MVAFDQRVREAEWGNTVSVSASARPSASAGRSSIRDEGVAERQAILARAIRADVIPRLVVARRRVARATAADMLVAGPIAADVSELAGIAMTRDVAPAVAFVESLRLRGSTMEALFLELLAPTARYLGELWEQDLADFGQVTVALTRLHQVLREFGPAFRGEAVATGRALRALLAPVPGEQHNFGLHMVAEFFRRAGWAVWGETMATRGELVAAVRRDWFAIVGLSLASEVKLEPLAACIRAIRQASRNPAVGIMVGGPIFLANPELVALVGADSTAIDGRDAAVRAQGLLALLPSDR